MANNTDTQPESSNSQVFELSKQGSNLLKTKQFDQARTVFEKALLISPSNPYLLIGMGDALRFQKKFSRAVDFYRQVLAKDPDNLFALLGLGDALRGLHRYLEAIEIWKRYLQHHQSDNIFVLTRVADSYKRLNDFDNAQSYYQQAYAIKPDDRYVLLGLADLYKIKGLDLLAIEHYEKALAGGVTMVSILTILGNLHWKQYNDEQSKYYFEMALEKEPDNSYALHGLGNYYRKTRNYQRAAELWEQILEKDAGTTNILARLGDAYMHLGQLDDAERSYSKGLKHGYEKYNLVGIMKLHCHRGHVKEVCDCYGELLQHEGSDTRFVGEINQLLLQNGHHDMALAFRDHVQKLTRSSSDTRLITDSSAAVGPAI